MVYKFKQWRHAGDMKIITCHFLTFAPVCLIEGLSVKLNDRETRFLNGFVPYEKGIKSGLTLKQKYPIPG